MKLTPRPVLTVAVSLLLAVGGIAVASTVAETPQPSDADDGQWYWMASDDWPAQVDDDEVWFWLQNRGSTLEFDSTWLSSDF